MSIIDDKTNKKEVWFIGKANVKKADLAQA
ncbi:MAG: hypothetical protein ACI8WB_002006 [Phenylobacterium sp.]|jgi:hypothetical protein